MKLSDLTVEDIDKIVNLSKTYTKSRQDRGYLTPGEWIKHLLDEEENEEIDNDDE